MKISYYFILLPQIPGAFYIFEIFCVSSPSLGKHVAKKLKLGRSELSE